MTAKKESTMDIFIQYEKGKIRIEAPLEIYPFEVKEVLEKSHELVCQYIRELSANQKPSNVKNTLKLVKMHLPNLKVS